MSFIEALKLACIVIEHEMNEQNSTLELLYIYEPKSQVQVYLKGYDGQLVFNKDKPIKEQIFLGAFLDKALQGTNLSLDLIFSDWEVLLQKTQRLYVNKTKNNSLVYEFYTEKKE